MANTASITIDKYLSLGSCRGVIGTLTLVGDGSTYNGLSDTTLGAGGLALTHAGVTITDENRLRAVCHFESELIALAPLGVARTTPTAGSGAASAAYEWEIRYGSSYCKLQLFGGAAAAEGPLGEPEGTAITSGTYVAKFLAIGK